MKKILIVIFLFTLSSSCFSQWVQQTSGVTGNLRDVEFINKNTGWAVGDGVIIKTTNAGVNWISIPHPAIGKPLFGVHPVDSNVVYVCGYFSTIIKTTNGGNSWVEIRNGQVGMGSSYIGIYFINENTGWIGGFSSAVLKTTDGGANFDSVYTGWGNVNDLYFINSSTGVFCTDGAVFKTTNAGINWITTNLPFGGALSQFKKFGKYNNQYIWVIGNDARVFRSTDFCETWSLLDTIEPVEPPAIRGVAFINQFTGFAGGDFGKLYKTKDAGYSWRRENTGTDQRFVGSIFFTNDTTGYACGGAGKMMYTEHGGMTSVNLITSFVPDNFELKQNYPNPFNPSTIIQFNLPKRQNVKLTIFNSLGKEVSVLVNEIKSAGAYQYTFNAKNLTSGIYFYKIETADFVQTKRMVLVK